MTPIYLDYAATTPIDPEVREAMLPYLKSCFGNPSSSHQFGQQALEGVENARRMVAELIGAVPGEIVFTSGGTESNNTAIKSVCFTEQKKGSHIVTTAFEHHAVLCPCRFMEKNGFHVTYLPVGSDGVVDPEDVHRALTEKTILISIMHANNEIGTVQPLKEIGKLAKEKGILFHTDAVQTVGHIDLNVRDLNLDFLSLSAHKLYGPKGVGALFIREGVPFEPLLHGGGHERGRRSSTHNVPGIVGLGKAAEMAKAGLSEESDHVRMLRDRLWQVLQSSISGIHLNGSRKYRLPNNLNISIEHVEGESLHMNLDMEGIAVSTGSACASESGLPSHVLRALGLIPELARGSLRITFGKYTTNTEIKTVEEKLPRIVKRFRDMAAF
ncbi:cysteine desulfurase NifS [bacterium]|nr:cysteine desulfurase NifS [bacterium]